MLLIENVGHIGLMSLTASHLGRHLEYFRTLNDARVASVGFIKYNASTTRINKEKHFKIKFRVILVFYRTNILVGLNGLKGKSIIIVNFLKRKSQQNKISLLCCLLLGFRSLLDSGGPRCQRLKVSYCGHWMSVVHRQSCAICRPKGH